MNPVFRAALMFAILWVVFRIGGRRTLAEITTFDFILLLIIGEATQNALIGDDFALTTAALVVVTLMLLDVGLGRLALGAPRFRRVIDSAPVVVIDNGKVLHDVMKQEGVTLDEVLAAARERHGIASIDGIRYAIVEQHGGISIIPKGG